MLTFNKYVRPQTIQEAYDLAQNPRNVIIGGMLWLKMQDRMVNTAIDLCDLNLDKIEESDDQFIIGSMVTLRQLELHEGLNRYTNQAMCQSVRHIVGVQFRNLATVGGSLFGRFGFSDVLTMFMALDAQVELAGAGIIPIGKFAEMPFTKDVLVRIYIKKVPLQTAYVSQRNTATDFPVLTCALSHLHDQYICVIGARPLKAMAFYDEDGILNGEIDDEKISAFASHIAKKIIVGSNMRGSREYRRRITPVLIKRAFKILQGEDHYGN